MARLRQNEKMQIQAYQGITLQEKEPFQGFVRGELLEVCWIPMGMRIEIILSHLLFAGSP